MIAEGPIRLQILTPQRLLIETQVECILAPSIDGALDGTEGPRTDGSSLRCWCF